MDFKKATELFADKDFDGDPVQIYKPQPDEPPIPPDVDEEETNKGDEVFVDPGTETEFPPEIDIDLPPDSRPKKYYVNDVPVSVVAERVQYYDKDGKLITESLKDYTKKTLHKEFKSLDDFLSRWTSTEKKEAIIKELEEHGIFLEVLEENVGKNYDPFDLICHIAWGKQPLTRKERALKVKKRNYFTKYGEQAQAVINALIDKYADDGITNIEDTKVLYLKPLSDYGTPMEIVQMIGGKEKFEELLHEISHDLYAA